MKNELLNKNIIKLDTEITNESAALICDQLLYLSTVDNSKEIKMYISSPGGSVDAGYAIIDMMRTIPNKVHTIASGSVASMAINVLINGDNRSGFENACYLVHNVRLTFGGLMFDETIDIMSKNAKFEKRRFFNEIKNNTNVDLEYLKNKTYLSKDWSFGSNLALRMGFIDNIIPRDNIKSKVKRTFSTPKYTGKRGDSSV